MPIADMELNQWLSYAESTRTPAGIKADTAMQRLFAYPMEYPLKYFQS